MSQEEYLTVAQVADKLMISPETVRRWIKSGKLGALSLGGSKLGYRIPVSAVDKLIQEARRVS